MIIKTSLKKIKKKDVVFQFLICLEFVCIKSFSTVAVFIRP